VFITLAAVWLLFRATIKDLIDTASKTKPA
jgi:hypothetical protein